MSLGRPAPGNQSRRPSAQRPASAGKCVRKWLYCSLGAGIVLLASCAAPQPNPDGRPSFAEEDKADLVVHYYSDDVSHISKPSQMEGAFQTSFDVNGVLNVAKAQPGRDLAVVVLIYFNSQDNVRSKWEGLLKDVGYHRVVCLQGGATGAHINGLIILADTAQPSSLQNPLQPKTPLLRPMPAASANLGPRTTSVH